MTSHSYSILLINHSIEFLDYTNEAKGTQLLAQAGVDHAGHIQDQ